MPEPEVDLSKLPMVTVVIPCHNHEKWVMEAVRSAIHQNYPKKRIVVVDDGSSDKSSDFVISELYSPKFVTNQEPKVAFGRVHNHDVDILVCTFKEARGPSFARNYGIRAGWDGTDIFAFLDSDDRYEQGKISQSVALFMENPAVVGAVYSDFTTFGNGLELRQYKEPFSRERLIRECIVNCDSLVSKLALVEVRDGDKFFDETLRVAEDYDLWLRISEKFTILHIAESLVSVRVGAHSSTDTVKKDIWNQCWQRVMQKTMERARAT